MERRIKGKRNVSQEKLPEVLLKKFLGQGLLRESEKRKGILTALNQRINIKALSDN